MACRIASEAIYDALLDDDSFAHLPALLAEAYGGRSTLLYWRHADGSNEVLAHSGYFTDDQLLLYAQHFADQDPWALAAVGRQADNVAMDLEQLVPQAQFERSGFYNEYVRAMGDDTARCMGVRVRTGWGSGSLGIQRGRRQKQFDAKMLAALDEDAAQLRRMLSLRGRMAGFQRQTRLFGAMLDCLPQAALLVRTDGRLLHANLAGERLLESREGIALRHGKVSALAHDDRFKAAMAAASPPNPAAGTVFIEGSRGRLIASTAPLRLPDGTRGVMLLLQPFRQANFGVAERLQSLFGLTAAESVVAARVADGLSPAEIAEQRGVSVATVRAQVKAVAMKLGCRRQAEIAALVKSLPPAADFLP